MQKRGRHNVVTACQDIYPHTVLGQVFGMEKTEDEVDQDDILTRYCYEDYTFGTSKYDRGFTWLTELDGHSIGFYSNNNQRLTHLEDTENYLLVNVKHVHVMLFYFFCKK